MNHHLSMACEGDVGGFDFKQSITFLCDSQVFSGNSIQHLNNGNEIFPAMLEAINGAADHIHFETFIYWTGRIGEQFADALAAKARAGVETRVLLDWLGSNELDESLIETMRQAGVQVYRYHPPRWYHLFHWQRLNNRTHRKVLVVDGEQGFTGGVGIADEWNGDAEGPQHWRDSHFLCRGPIVNQLQAVFLDNWIETTGEVLGGSRYLPYQDQPGDWDAQVFRSSPREGSGNTLMMYLLAFTHARESILISTPYFVPDSNTREVLLAAARRGVRVEIIVPGQHIDSRIVRHASRQHYGQMLRLGVRMFEYLPTMYHYKAVVVDGKWCSVGSTNLDYRSLHLNDEANLNIESEEAARMLTQTFEQDKTRCRELDYLSWRKRPLHIKLMDRAAQLVGGAL